MKLHLTFKLGEEMLDQMTLGSLFQLNASTFFPMDLWLQIQICKATWFFLLFACNCGILFTIIFMSQIVRCFLCICIYTSTHEHIHSMLTYAGIKMRLYILIQIENKEIYLCKNLQVCQKVFGFHILKTENLVVNFRIL